MKLSSKHKLIHAIEKLESAKTRLMTVDGWSRKEIKEIGEIDRAIKDLTEIVNNDGSLQSLRPRS